MKKWQMVASSVLTVGMVGGLVAGCGTSGSTSSNGGGSSTANGTASSQPALPTGQTITLWSWVPGGSPQLADVKAIAAAWAKQHGDTVKVVDESKNPNGFQFFATAARTGKGPDVLVGMPHDNNGLFAQEGLLAPVPQGMVDTSKYPQSVISAATVNGKLYSVPFGTGTYALFYNKKLVSTPPTNWSQFVSDANAHGFMYAQHNLYYNYAFIGGMGGYVFKNNNGTLDPKKIGLDNSGAVQAFTLMHNMDSQYHWMTPSTTGAVAKAKFIAGKIGMYISGPWDIPDIKKAGIDYGIATLPTLSNGQAATPFMTVYTAIVSANSKTQPADWSLVQALTNAQAQKTYFKDAQQLPALTSVQQSSTVQNNSDFKAFANQVTTAVPMPNIPQMQAVWSAMSVIANIISGKTTPAQGAKDFVTNIQKGIQVQNQ
ncbi:sugar ABC transporter substrate-binding protein [Alicyclobacillus mengziensis]|uniref:Maltodextrin-binding protein n=1 Tax=Alicyclobacillus mengziensis TaxID=2931921 RepID=A0A9X7W424_9BACL|nr:maltose ABC transporter substrate-binding protein [Alicyclobacillus mengziensis]QSO49073.1 maltose ABC transporter substrate-binding protein [Alicyclobacillus mengziensis]